MAEPELEGGAAHREVVETGAKKPSTTRSHMDLDPPCIGEQTELHDRHGIGNDQVLRTPPPPMRQRRRSTLSARKPRKSRRQSVLHQELEMLSKLREQESRMEEEMELGLVTVKDADAATDTTEDRDEKNSAQPQGGDGGGGEAGGRLVSHASRKLSESNKLEDQINLQHLIELMRIFHVSA